MLGKVDVENSYSRENVIVEQQDRLGLHVIQLETHLRNTPNPQGIRKGVIHPGTKVNILCIEGHMAYIDSPKEGWFDITHCKKCIPHPTSQSPFERRFRSEFSDHTSEYSQPPYHKQNFTASSGAMTHVTWIPEDSKSHSRNSQDHSPIDHHLYALENDTYQLENEIMKLKLEMRNREDQLQQYTTLREQDLLKQFSEQEQEWNQHKQIYKEKIWDLQEEICTKQNAFEELEKSVSENKGLSISSYGTDSSKKSELRMGDVVLLKNGDIVIIRYIGRVHWEKGVFIGVELSDPVGTCDGVVNGKKYFKCAKKHGDFVQNKQVQKKVPPDFLLQKLHQISQSIKLKN